ncbi:hypothetical protein HMPREF9120_00540 [Neisseria sp. oral taxon 020 str. F0370]|nr:hypothetical protein HMPREF9120_00540 [Neisseria sp. oral taxon 020 str. F0370]
MGKDGRRWFNFVEACGFQASFSPALLTGAYRISTAACFSVPPNACGADESLT